MIGIVVVDSVNVSENCSSCCIVGGSAAVSTAVSGSVSHPARVPLSVAAVSSDTVRPSNSVSYNMI